MSLRRHTMTRTHCRRGVALVESALTLSASALLLASLLDLGLMTLQFNSLGHACRTLARVAATRGADSTFSGESPLGPATLTGLASDGSTAASAFATLLPTMTPASVGYSVQWPDGDNGVGDRVTVTLQHTHQPLIPGLNFWGAVGLSATSSMRIVN